MATSGAKPSRNTDLTGYTDRDARSARGTITSAEPPANISEQARPFWDVVAPSLIGMKLIRPEDLHWLHEFCEALALADYYRNLINDCRTRLAKIAAEMEAAEEVGNQQRVDDLLAREYGLEQRQKRAFTGWRDSLTLSARLGGELSIGPVARIRTGLLKAGSEGSGLLSQLAAHVKEIESVN